MTDHPSFDIQETLSSKLKGKTIILGITGSVAAVSSIEIARLLLRHGATIIPAMSESSTKLIGEDLVYWATGIKPITKLDGSVQHVHYAGNTKTKADLFLIAPSTANTISKIANGIDDTTVTTFATTAIGENIPIIIVPAMHLPMYQHPIVKQNIEKLKNLDIDFIEPTISEGKAKIASPAEIVENVISKLLHSKKKLLNKKVLITAGRTVEYIDKIRVITNNSSGKMGEALAKAALEQGAEVTIVCGKVSTTMPANASTISVETTEQMAKSVEDELKNQFYDFVICAAAVNDWKAEVVVDGKISTHTNSRVNITLVPTEKILDKVKIFSPKSKVVAFRAIPENSFDKLVENAKSRMASAQADFIAANNVLEAGAGFECSTNHLVFVDKSGRVKDSGISSKYLAAVGLIDFITE